MDRKSRVENESPSEVTEREPFLLRLSPELMSAIKSYAKDEMRSANSQIGHMLESALLEANRHCSQCTSAPPSPEGNEKTLLSVPSSVQLAEITPEFFAVSVTGVSAGRANNF